MNKLGLLGASVVAAGVLGSACGNSGGTPAPPPQSTTTFTPPPVPTTTTISSPPVTTPSIADQYANVVDPSAAQISGAWQKVTASVNDASQSLNSQHPGISPSQAVANFNRMEADWATAHQAFLTMFPNLESLKRNLLALPIPPERQADLQAVVAGVTQWETDIVSSGGQPVLTAGQIIGADMIRLGTADATMRAHLGLSPTSPFG